MKKLPRKVKLAIDEFVEACKKKFGKNLVSIVLFGSYARGIARETSDIDLLVVVKKLPHSLKKRIRIEGRVFESIENRIFEKYGKSLQIIVLDKADVKNNLKSFSPLFITFALGFKIIYDENFFIPSFKEFLLELRKRNFKYFEGSREWDIRKESWKILRSL
jgi:predicted nucleotidyltransferase